jgi:hypothetical protein
MILRLVIGTHLSEAFSKYVKQNKPSLPTTSEII